MTLDGFWAVFLCGAFGGLLGELLKWYRLRERKVLPQYARSPFCWGITLAVVLSGGGLSVLYGTEEVNALLALNIGVSAPLLIQGLSSTHLNSRRGGKTQRPTKTEKSGEEDIAKYLRVEAQPSLWRFLAG